jgi:hypothetical protein
MSILVPLFAGRQGGSQHPRPFESKGPRPHVHTFRQCAPPVCRTLQAACPPWRCCARRSSAELSKGQVASHVSRDFSQFVCGRPGSRPRRRLSRCEQQPLLPNVCLPMIWRQCHSMHWHEGPCGLHSARGRELVAGFLTANPDLLFDRKVYGDKARYHLEFDRNRGLTPRLSEQHGMHMPGSHPVSEFARQLALVGEKRGATQ